MWRRIGKVLAVAGALGGAIALAAAAWAFREFHRKKPGPTMIFSGAEPGEHGDCL